MAHGLITARIACQLRDEYEPKGFQILSGHGDKTTDPPDRIGKLRAYYSDRYGAASLLADLDIAIATPNQQAIALIEIEETTFKPKVILGDALATLLGSAVRFGRHDWYIGEWTTLIIMAHGSRERRQGRMAYLEDQINQMKTTLSTTNAKASVAVRAFQEESDLFEALRGQINLAVERFAGIEQIGLAQESG